MKDHYNAVRKSDLYEYAGISKPLLMLIAGLVISEPKRGSGSRPRTTAGLVRRLAGHPCGHVWLLGRGSKSPDKEV